MPQFIVPDLTGFEVNSINSILWRVGCYHLMRGMLTYLLAKLSLTVTVLIERAQEGSLWKKIIWVLTRYMGSGIKVSGPGSANFSEIGIRCGIFRIMGHIFGPKKWDHQWKNYNSLPLSFVHASSKNKKEKRNSDHPNLSQGDATMYISDQNPT